MSAPFVRTALTTAAGVLALALLGGSAWAQTTPQPTGSPDATTSPVPDASATSPSPADPSVPLPSPTITNQPTAPSEAVAGSPSSSTAPVPAAPDPAAPSASATGGFGDAPPSDGVDLAAGQTDAYLVEAAARDAAAARLAALAAALVRAQAVATRLEQGRSDVVMSVALARVAVLDAQSTTDDVVRDLYQQGDAGIGAFATILADGPEGLLDRVDTARMATSTAYGVVGRSVDARDRLALAIATQQQYDAKLGQARAAVVSAQHQVDTARVVLATAEARLTSLGAAAPQVAVGVDGCPTVDVPATLRDGAEVFGAAKLCRAAVLQAATPQAALALTWAFQHLGAVYACKGVGRMEPWRADCSSFVSRAYADGAGLATAGTSWAPSTRNMVPWDGVALDPHYAYVAPAALRPGDLVLYDTCPQGGCPYKHVVMYLGSPDGGRTRWMLHTNACGDVAKVTRFWGFPTTGHPFLVARRVVALAGETVRSVDPVAARIAARAAVRLATASAVRLPGIR